MSKPDSRVRCASGKLQHDADSADVLKLERRLLTGELTFVLYDGRRYEGVPGQKDFRIVSFVEHGIPIRADRDEEPDGGLTPSSEGQSRVGRVSGFRHAHCVARLRAGPRSSVG